MLNGSFPPWPSYTQEEARAIQNTLLSNKVNYWTGKECKKFESEFADYTGCEYAVALANGTLALELALKAIDIGAGDEVVVTPRTFFASVSCIVNAGARPVFCDVDIESQNITAETILPVLSNQTKAIICVHLAGWPCDMDPIMSLAKERNLFVIEDCAQAHGARYKGKSVGSIGHIGCWSFCQDKIITTGGEGGMVTTNHQDLWKKIWSLKDHGKSWDVIFNQRDKNSGFLWCHENFGTNARMTEIQAVIGRIQLRRLPEWQRKRLEYATEIWSSAAETKSLVVPKLKCSGCDGNCFGDLSGCLHAAYKCYVFVAGNEGRRDDVIKKINEFNVPCYEGSCSEVYRELAFDNTNLRPKHRLPNAKKLGDRSIMFLCHPTLTIDDVEKTKIAIKKVCD